MVSWWLVVELDRKLVLCEAEVVVHNVAVRMEKARDIAWPEMLAYSSQAAA